jgi:hypothetical protein
LLRLRQAVVAANDLGSLPKDRCCMDVIELLLVVM